MNLPMFREATIDDLSNLLRLEQNIIDFERPYDPHIKESGVTYYDFEYLITGSDSYLLVVESGGKIVGSGYAQIRPSRECLSHDSHCYLGFIYLEPAQRGKALGQRILDELKAWGVNRDMKHFQLNVYCENVSAIRAYERAGFNKVSVMMELIV